MFGDCSSAVRDRLHQRNEPIAPPRQSFNVARRLGVVVQHLPQLLDVRVQAVFEINEGVFGPEMLTNLLTGDQLAGMFQQKGKNGDALTLQFELGAVLIQLARLAVEFERSKTDLLRGRD